MEQLITLSKKMTSLLIEYREAIKYESCKYHLVEETGTIPKRYFLYSIEDQKQLVYGTKERISSYLGLRCINTNLIYNYTSVFISEL